MKYRPLGRTGLQLSWLGYGASSLGQEFRAIDVNEALRSVGTALDLGINFIDTSPYYGRGMSECLLGIALRGVPRDRYYLGTKVAHPDMATCIVGSANPDNVRNWVKWAETPIDENLLREVLHILEPIHNWFYIEGRPENNDPPK
jgi:aryl-alcohol dehydrogenase-like predicted oxidoreductase